MHIKSVTIQGFKSYDQQIFPEDFSPKLNVIVGQNGSGKSNFFFAIQFVLSEKYSSLRSEERREMLHEGAGRAAMSAFVEIVFENSDRRLMVDWGNEDEIRIRRTIGLKKDEFRVNNKTHSAKEVQQLLETAGFSSSNPYYIVQQGKISALATMKEAERLGVLKEVAGTKVYDDRRAESLRLLAEADQKILKIDESIGAVGSRLQELETDKDELTKYRELEKGKRAIEYTIYERQLVAAREKIAEIDMAKASGTPKGLELQERLVQVQRKLKETEKRRSEQDVVLAEYSRERAGIEEERKRLHLRRTDLGISLNEIQSQAQRSEKDRAALQSEAGKVEAEVKTKSSELQASKLEVNTARYKENVAQNKLLEKDTRLNELHARSGRVSQFKTAAERNKWIDRELQKNEENRRAGEVQVEQLKKEIQQLERRLASGEAERKTHRDKLNECIAQIDQSEKKKSALTEKRDISSNQRRKLWKDSTELEKELRQLKEDTEKASRRLDKTMSREIKQGLESVEEVVRQHHIAGVYGPILNLIQVRPEFFTAVEATAGNALFNVVVDDDSTASTVLQHINREGREGRVTLMPLNRLTAQPMALPTTADVRPLLSVMQFEPKFLPAFAEIFGRTLLADTLEQASLNSKALNCDAITLGGDKVDRRGAMTGGFLDARASRLTAHTDLKSSKEKLSEKQQTFAKLQQELTELDQVITASVAELQRVTEAGHGLRAQLEQQRLENAEQSETTNTTAKALEEKQRSVELLLQSKKEIEATVASLTAERQAELRTKLTAAEEEELQKLTSERLELAKELAQAQAQRAEAEAKARVLGDAVAALGTRQTELSQQLYGAGVALTSAAERERAEKEAQRLDASLKETDDRLAALDRLAETAVREKQAATTSLQELQAEKGKLTLQVQEERAQAELLLNDRSIQLSKEEEAVRKIRSLGAITTEVERYKEMNSKKLLLQLHKINESLEKYGAVNKKAMEQYSALVDTQESLSASRAELEEERRSIQKLVQHLDSKKDEAIQRTFKQVKHEFEQIFQRLVGHPGASAELQMQRRLEGPSPASQRSSTESTDVFVGVRIQANFGVGGVSHTVERLSGGQKSLVALALIFAIQRCDPAPFYLFDEIDAALDDAYRRAVATMIQEQSETAQFLTSTFKSELVDVADHHYGIIFKNKVSKISRITPQQAHSILQAAAATPVHKQR
eukprot:RCo042806